MTDERHERLRNIFAEACDLPPDERSTRLDELCADDPTLRVEVESLLRHDAQPTIDFDDAAVKLDELDDESPERIGAYRIHSVLGRGGMGIVYRAEQESPRRTVALKLIRPGMAHDETLRRFKHEADLLGRLQHPGIAQVYEVGSATVPGGGQQPYFTMELIPGEPLNTHVEARCLPREERLRLLVKVCDAVQHAHQNGVIHRDLKPSNILVSAPPSEPDRSSTAAPPIGDPKILDFGVARSLTASEQTALTEAGQLVGTMDYMSPEQSAGRAHEVDARSDVYALGVIAYELLADRLPFDTRHDTIPHAARRIAEETPPRLSTHDRRLRGDLETIVGKAMDKDPDRRYQSASELAADFGRHLRDEPVLARPPSAAYQMRKFARRHRGVFIASVALVLAVVAGSIVSTTGWLRALSETRRANVERETTAAINEFLTDMLHSVDPARTMNPDLPVRDVLDQAAQEIGVEFPDRPLIRAGLHATIGRTYTALGLYDAAREHLESALELRRAELAPTDPSIGDSLHDLAMNEKHAGVFAAALTWAEELVAFDEAQLGPGHVTTLNARIQNAVLLSALSRFDEAGAIFDETLPRWRVLEPDGSALFGVALNDHGTHLAEIERYDEAAAAYRAAIALHETFDGVDSLPVALAHVNLSKVLTDLGETEDALDHLAQGRAVRSARLDPDHAMLTSLHHFEAMIRSSRGEIDLAAAAFERSIEAHRGGGPDRSLILATSLKGLGDIRNQQGRPDEAVVLLEESLDIARRELGRRHVITANILNSLASTYSDLDRTDDARQAIHDAIDVIRDIHGPSSGNLAGLVHMLATLEMKAGEYEAARDRFAEGLAMLLEHRPDDQLTIAFFHENSAIANGRLGDLAGAREGLESSLAIRRANLPPMHPSIAASLQNLSAVCRMLEDYDASETAVREALEIYDHAFDGAHPQKAACLVVLGSVVRDGGAPRDAEPILRDALEMRAEIHDDASVQMAEVRLELAVCLLALGAEAEAAELLSQACAVLQAPGAPARLRERCEALSSDDPAS